MATDNTGQITRVVTGLITVLVGAAVTWKLNEYSANNARVEQLIRELEINKASTEYVDKENDKQDARTEKRFDKIDGKLDYIIDRIDRISTR